MQQNFTATMADQPPKNKKPHGTRVANKQLGKFAEELVTHGNRTQAAEAIGENRMAGSRLAKHPEVKKIIAETRLAIVEKVKYTAIEAMKEAEMTIQFARETENASAMVKAVELRSKLMGLLVDKIDLRASVGFKVAISGIDDEPVREPEPVEVAYTEAKETPIDPADESWDPFAD